MRVFNLKKNASNYILFAILLIVTYFFIFLDLDVHYSSYVLLIFFGICTLSLYGVFLSIDQQPYSINKTFNIFNYFFFGLAPSYQFKNQMIFFDYKLLSDQDYIKLGILLLVTQLFYLIGYRFSFKKINKSKIYNLLKIRRFEFFDLSYIFLSFVSFLFFFVLIKFNYRVVFFKPVNNWMKMNTLFGSIGYAFLLIVRSIPVIVLLLYKLNNRKNAKLSTILILLLIVLFTAFPSSLSRVIFANYYLGLLLVFIPLFKKKHIYSLFFFVNVLFVFPILNFFRNFDVNQIQFGKRLFLTAHFDAFNNFAHLYKENIITNGKQLFGSILFFIPKSIWENKPTGTGHLLAERLDYCFTNISMPLWGEGYGNFGYLGVLLFLLLLIVVNSLLDAFNEEAANNKLISIFFFFMISFEFYLLRGDLYSSINKLSSFILALIISYISLKAIDFCIRFLKMF